MKTDNEIYNDELAMNSSTFGNLELANSMVIATQNGDITIHCDTGEVEYPDSLSDAAKEFWLALESAYPSLFRSRAKGRNLLCASRQGALPDRW